VWESPKPIRRRFVESYVAHRGVHFETKATTRIQEERPASYLADLHDLIDESVTSTVSRGPVDSRFLQMLLANSGCNAIDDLAADSAAQDTSAPLVRFGYF